MMEDELEKLLCEIPNVTQTQLLSKHADSLLVPNNNNAAAAAFYGSYFNRSRPRPPNLMSDHPQRHPPRLPRTWPNIESRDHLYDMQLQLQLHFLNLHHPHPNISSRFPDSTRRRFDLPLSHHHHYNAYTIPRASNTTFSPSLQFTAWADKATKLNSPQTRHSPNCVKFGPNGRHFVRTQFDNARPWDVYSDRVADDLKSSPLISRYNSLNEVSGRIYLMAKDQYGCRFLQRKFSDGTRDEVDMIFSEIIHHIVDLMTDPFGNYLVQKLLEVCDEDQRMKVLDSITTIEGELVRVSCDMHGTRAVQKIIETLKTAEQFSMVVSSLDYNAVGLMKNMNGNHVAQKCLQHLMPEFSKFLYEAATENCVELSQDRHGCCVLQKCLGQSDGEQRSRLISEVAANALILSQDQYGNYVVQFVFDLKLPWATKKVLENLEGSFADLSVQKHSSNVVERCLKLASEEQRSWIIQELIDNPRFDQIMQDPFGNYVTQAALDKARGDLYVKLVEAIKPHIGMIRTSPYGKKVLTRLTCKK